MQFSLESPNTVSPRFFKGVFSRVFVVTLLVVLSACSPGTSTETADQNTASRSDSDSSQSTKGAGVVEGVNPATVETEGTAAPTDEGSDTDSAEVGQSDAADTDDAAGASGAGGAGEAAREYNETEMSAAQNFMDAFFSITPSEKSSHCLIDNADEALLELMGDPVLGFGQLADYDVLRLAKLAGKCGDPYPLGMWAAEKVQPSEQAMRTAPICYGDRFAQNPNAFANIVAFFRPSEQDPAYRDDAIAILAECTPVNHLWDTFITHAVSSQNYAIEVDRQCLLDGTDPAELSLQFWGEAVDGTDNGAQLISALIDQCSKSLYPDLLSEVPEDFVPWSATKALAAVAPPARHGIYTAAPPMNIDPDKTYQAVFTTEDGSFTIDLDSEKAPITVNSFVNLARDGFYDQTRFHRVIPGFMAQGGDPTSTGAGGPGYEYPDELDGIAFDQPGVIGAANAGPGTNGSQFFVTNAPADFLSGQYTSFGLVSEGLEVIQAIDLRDPETPDGPGELLISVEIIES